MNLLLRRAKAEDIFDVFNLSNEDYVRKYSINAERINWNDHVRWFKTVINSDAEPFYIVTDINSTFLGQIRYRLESDIAIVSISLCRDILGKGFSVPLLKDSINLLSKQFSNVKLIYAFVSEDNIASMRLFEKAKFHLIETTGKYLKYAYEINME